MSATETIQIADDVRGAHSLHRLVRPSGYWGRRPYFSSKVGSMSSAMVLIKGARKYEPTAFHEGQRIQFCDTDRLRGMTTGCTPQWRTGTIWKLECDDGRIFISLV